MDRFAKEKEDVKTTAPTTNRSAPTALEVLDIIWQRSTFPLGQQDMQDKNSATEKMPGRLQRQFISWNQSLLAGDDQTVKNQKSKAQKLVDHSPLKAERRVKVMKREIFNQALMYTIVSLMVLIVVPVMKFIL